MGFPVKSIIQYASVLEGSVVEIGSERGEGSTAFLSNFCKKFGLKFYSVDFEDNAYQRAKNIPNTIAIQSTGEEFLRNFPKGEKICYAYLDNHDWNYGDEELHARTKRKYDLYGLDLSNKNSQQAHLDQAMLVSELASKKCIISFDDTFYDDELKCVSGKGGTAHTWLSSKGWSNYKYTDYFNFYDRNFFKECVKYHTANPT